MGKEWIQLLYLHLGINTKADWGLYPWYGNRSRRKIKFKSVKLRLKMNLCRILLEAERMSDSLTVGIAIMILKTISDSFRDVIFWFCIHRLFFSTGGLTKTTEPNMSYLPKTGKRKALLVRREIQTNSSRI